MSSAPIAVTGLGIWSVTADDIPALWERARRGVSGARWWDGDATRTAVCMAPDPPPCSEFPQAHRMDRSTRLALAAARRAFDASHLRDFRPDRIAILVGNSRGPAELWQHPTPRAGRVRPSQAARTAVASLSGALSLALGVQGPCLTVSATCASAAHAIALGANLLHGGVVDAVLAGGAEAPLVPALIAQFRAAGLLGSHDHPALACRPFDAARNGIVPGEGAGFLVLERESDARARGAAMEGRLVGWAMGSESFNRVAARPDGQGLVRTLRTAFETAGILPDAVAYLNAHGTGTRVNDVAEAAAIQTVFGERAQHLLFSSTKPVTGHGFGAAAAWEAILTLLALQRQEAPPTTGWATPDPEIGLIPVRGTAATFAGEYAVSTSLGFWGNTATLIFGKVDKPEGAHKAGLHV